MLFEESACGVQDPGAAPYVTDLRCRAAQNPYFRHALWTGKHLQATLMCIPVGGEIGFETHAHVDQMLYLISGCGEAKFSDRQCPVHAGDAVFIPSCAGHNLINTGCTPLKIVSVYAPPQHPRGVTHRTKCEAEQHE